SDVKRVGQAGDLKTDPSPFQCAFVAFVLIPCLLERQASVGCVICGRETMATGYTCSGNEPSLRSHSRIFSESGPRSISESFSVKPQWQSLHMPPSQVDQWRITHEPVRSRL